jgi:uncharacterized protein YbjT (DUF2867 family)
MNVFQIGAAGGVGRRLASLLTAHGHQVTGMHRASGQSDTITATGARPVVGDLITDSVDDLAARFDGHDVVVFSAGAHGTGQDKTTAIDGEGLKKAVDAAVRASVTRFVLISVFPDALREQECSEGFEHYVRVKKSADIHLAASSLDWLIVRPGDLLDVAGNGHVSAGPAIAYGAVPRDDVAAFLHAALHEPRLNRTIVELTSGEVPVDDAVQTLVSSARPAAVPRAN